MNKKVETAKEDKKEEETSLDNDKKDVPEVEAQKTDTVEPNNEDKGFVLVDPPKNNTPNKMIIIILFTFSSPTKISIKYIYLKHNKIKVEFTKH